MNSLGLPVSSFLWEHLHMNAGADPPFYLNFKGFSTNHRPLPPTKFRRTLAEIRTSDWLFLVQSLAGSVQAFVGRCSRRKLDTLVTLIRQCKFPVNIVIRLVFYTIVCFEWFVWRCPWKSTVLAEASLTTQALARSLVRSAFLVFICVSMTVVPVHRPYPFR